MITRHINNPVLLLLLLQLLLLLLLLLLQQLVLLLLLLLLVMVMWPFLARGFRVGSVVMVVLVVLLLQLLLLVYGRGHDVAGDRVVPGGCGGGGCRDRVPLGGRVLDVVLLEERRETGGRETGRGRHAMRETGGKVREQRMRRHLDASAAAGLRTRSSGRSSGRASVSVGRGRSSRGVQP